MDLSKVIEKVPPDQLRAIAAITSCIPLGIINFLIPGRIPRLLYSLIFGLIIQCYTYRIDMLQIASATLINLLILNIVDRKKVGLYCFIYNMTHNACLNLHRFFFDPERWSVDISFLFCITVLKFSGFAFSYQDGLATAKDDDLTDQQKKYIKKYKVENYTILEYLSYIYFYGTATLGPFIEFSDFKNFIEKKEEYTKISFVKTMYASFSRLFTFLFFLGIFTLLKPYSNIEILLNPESTIQTKLIAYFLGVIYEMRYIYGFCLIEIGILASGFFYVDEEQKKIEREKEKDNQVLAVKDDEIYDKGRCIKIKQLFLIFAPTDFFKYWNVSVHLFFKRYVFSRMLSPKSTAKDKAYASQVVFFISALWHGFNINYFFLFGHFYAYTLLEKQVRTFLTKTKIKVPSIMINFTRIVILTTLIQYHCFICLCLDSAKLFEYFKSVGAFGSILILISNLIMFIVNNCVKNEKST